MYNYIKYCSITNYKYYMSIHLSDYEIKYLLAFVILRITINFILLSFLFFSNMSYI